MSLQQNNKRIFAAAVTFAILSGVLAGCNPNTGTVSSAVTPASPSSTAASSSAASSSSEAPASSVPEASAPASQAVSQPPESGSVGQVIPIETDDQGFDEKFSENPIDKAYIRDNNEAMAASDMVEVSDKYAEIWKKEVESAYERLLMAAGEDKSQYEQEQKAWQNDEAAAIGQIQNEAEAAGGTMAQVDAAGRIMDYYRNRANALYKALYRYDKDFGYQYAGE